MMSVNLEAYKDEYNVWVFDRRHKGIKLEALCDGTDMVLDVYYKLFGKRDPKPNDRIRIFVSTEVLENADTVLAFKRTKKSAYIYREMELNLEVCISPWLDLYFNEVPAKFM